MANTGSSRNLKRKREQKQSRSVKSQGFLDMIFHWSLADILNNHLYNLPVEEIPLTFSSTTHYINSFIPPLLEETRSDLFCQVTGISQAPASVISDFQRSQPFSDTERLCCITLHRMSYSPKVGDLVTFTQVKPRRINDLDRPYCPFFTAVVHRFIKEKPMTIEILSRNLIDSHPVFKMQRTGTFLVYLTNLTTNMRIWNALNPYGNMDIIKRTLSFSPLDARSCDKCCAEGEKGGVINSGLRLDSLKLNTSQEAAVLTCIAANSCVHQNCTKLIWGPPGTGKTKTVASLLFVLLRMNHRTLTCAPTNIAVVGVVKRLLSLLKDHDMGCFTYRFGDIVLFGNEGRMDVKDDHKELHDVFLDYRIEALLDCLSLWKIALNDFVELLGSLTEKSCRIEEKFRDLAEKLISYIKSLCTHLPSSVLSLDHATKMHHAIDLIQKVNESQKKMATRNKNKIEAFLRINECLQALKDLQATLCIPVSMKGVELHCIPKSMKRVELESFCLRNARLIFCTASSSSKLCRIGMTPIELVLMDEAAQLKECESIIPLTLHGVRNAVLVGDERQLPSMVQSKICEDAKFGRSLFERLVLLGHEKQLLNVQYRMHPAISQFPNFEFYDKMLLDGPNVIDSAHEKRFLEGNMYKPYSFINVDFGNEELDKYNSTKNMLEVAVITEIVANLSRESVAKKQKVTIGCISPYKAQVDAIKEKLEKYNQEEKGSYCYVKVRSIDGFQGSEEDVIIFSTVRCNKQGSVGFLSSRERTNVALTRARHCLWIVGNKETMIKSGSIWNTLVFDAESRGCVYNAVDDKDMANVMLHTMVELAQFGWLLEPDSILFKESKWKVNFTNTFIERISSITSLNLRRLVLSLVVKLSSGWRDLRKNSRNLLETYSIDGQSYLVWSVDIAHENSSCVQVLMFWDILPLSQIRQRLSCLEGAFRNYTLDMIDRCQTKHFDGRNQVLPITWPTVDPELYRF